MQKTDHYKKEFHNPAGTSTGSDQNMSVQTSSPPMIVKQVVKAILCCAAIKPSDNLKGIGKFETDKLTT